MAHPKRVTVWVGQKGTDTQEPHPCLGGLRPIGAEHSASNLTNRTNIYFIVVSIHMRGFLLIIFFVLFEFTRIKFNFPKFSDKLGDKMLEPRSEP